MTNLAPVEWKKDVLETAADRFERRLTEESAALRLDMANMRGELKNDMANMRAELKSDMANMRAEFKSDMGRLHGSLIKWMFVFWIGQLGITLTIVGVIFRAVRLL